MIDFRLIDTSENSEDPSAQDLIIADLIGVQSEIIQIIDQRVQDVRTKYT